MKGKKYLCGEVAGYSNIIKADRDSKKVGECCTKRIPQLEGDLRAYDSLPYYHNITVNFP